MILLINRQQHLRHNQLILFAISTLAALSTFLDKAAIFLIPCPFKYLTNFDCPGCGFQRSVLPLMHGDIVKSFLIYPPAIPFVISAIAGITTTILKGNTNSKILKVMYIATGIIMLVNYIYKIATHQLH